MMQEVHATVRIKIEADAEATQGELLAGIARIIEPLNNHDCVIETELLGVLEEAEIYHPEGVD